MRTTFAEGFGGSYLQALRDYGIDYSLSTKSSARLAESYGMPHDRIILSAKVSGVQDLVDVYRALGQGGDYPLHLGLTEAGMGSRGIISSTAGLAVLLQRGIGDTIRVSHAPAGGDRTDKSPSRSRCSSPSDCGASPRRSPPVPAAAAPPAPSSSKWPRIFRATCGNRCRSGEPAIPVSRN